MISRRNLLGGALAAPVVAIRRAGADERDADLQRGVAALEERHGGRLGVAVLDSADRKAASHRGEERFPLCSTFKALAAALVLARVDRGEDDLARRIVYPSSDLVPYSPVTGKHAGRDGLTVGEICEAAVTLSDNTAGNLMLASFGGPEALTRYLRSLGDGITRLDRTEPTLNEARPGDPRDTTTPLAMAETIRTLVLGTALSASSRAHLIGWLVANKTGDKRLRADIPPNWRVGDKTGAGENNTTNDVAVLWPPGRAPLIVTALYTASRGSEDERNAVLAEVGRLAAAA